MAGAVHCKVCFGSCRSPDQYSQVWSAHMHSFLILLHFTPLSYLVVCLQDKARLEQVQDEAASAQQALEETDRKIEEVQEAIREASIEVRMRVCVFASVGH